jgi:hypothetical protein
MSVGESSVGANRIICLPLFIRKCYINGSWYCKRMIEGKKC